MWVTVADAASSVKCSILLLASMELNGEQKKDISAVCLPGTKLDCVEEVIEQK